MSKKFFNVVIFLLLIINILIVSANDVVDLSGPPVPPEATNIIKPNMLNPATIISILILLYVSIFNIICTIIKIKDQKENE